MTTILTPQIRAEIKEALEHFGASCVTVKTTKDKQNIVLGYKAKKRHGIIAIIDNIDFDFFLRSGHHARRKSLRRLISKALAVLIKQGVDFKAINKARA